MFTMKENKAIDAILGSMLDEELELLGSILMNTCSDDEMTRMQEHSLRSKISIEMMRRDGLIH